MSGPRGLDHRAEAAGALSLRVVQRLIDGGLVSEPRVDIEFDFRMELSNILPEKHDVQVQAVLEIDGVNITLPFTIHFVPGTAGVELVATRIKTSN